MSPRLRVFVSSTMEDLRNERREVVKQIESLVMEPVNAENLHPNGGSSWEVIANELATCHLFVVISGDRYGWNPDEGYGAGLKKSVTHLEVEEARRLKLPILPFFKELAYSDKPPNPDAANRNAFRRELGDWAAGQFKRDFKYADDLGDAVRRALLGFMSDRTLKALIHSLEPPPPAPPASRQVASQPGAFLFAGAGMSLAAGFPPAVALADILAVSLGWSPRGGEILTRYPFGDLAALVEAQLGRPALIALISQMMEPPLPGPPTAAHLAAVQRFRIIITTNYDALFEAACEQLNLSYAVNLPGRPVAAPGRDVAIFKLDGSIAEPETLVLTHDDARRARADTAYWTMLADIFQHNAPTIVGHSLRDETSRRLLSERNMGLEGVYVTPALTDLDVILLHRFGLAGVTKPADDFFNSPAPGVAAFGEGAGPSDS